MGSALPGMAVLGSIKKQVEQAMRSKQVSSTPSWLLFQFLLPNSSSWQPVHLPPSHAERFLFRATSHVNILGVLRGSLCTLIVWAMNLSMYGIWFPMAERTCRQVLKGVLLWCVRLDEGVSQLDTVLTQSRGEKEIVYTTCYSRSGRWVEWDRHGNLLILAENL